MSARIVEGDGDPRHGTYNGYNNLACRCQPCRDAFAGNMREQRARRSEREPQTHGSRWTYNNWLCRCAPCRAAHAAYMRSRRAAKRAAA